MILYISSLYLDYQATTPLASEVLETICSALKEAWANPSSGHMSGTSESVYDPHFKMKIVMIVLFRPESKRNN